VLGKLYIVATPIGNLDDISKRALTVLQEVDSIACENPRHTTKLLNHYNIKKPLDKFFEHNEKEKSQILLSKLSQGQNIALVSDAGTPLISDPGYNIVKLAQQAGISVIPIVGPCALIGALSASGLETNRFAFEGFLATKQTLRLKQLASMRDETRTIVLYETPHRIQACLEDCIHTFGLMRVAVVARELTKKFEVIKQLPLGQLYQWLVGSKQDKGEIVLLIQGAEKTHHHHDMLPLIKKLQPIVTGKQLVEAVRALTGCSKQSIYKAVEHINHQSD
jgi:16S rRNA (cytidine1402-2'-O)-methyltransferase